MTSFSDDPDEQLDSLNLLFTECLERHAPLRKVKVTRPPAPWMETPHIEDLQQERNTLRHAAHLPNAHSSTWNSFRSVRNRLKQAIRSARKSFIEKALSSNKSREIWRVIHRILGPSPKPLRIDPDELNVHFSTTAQRTIEAPATSLDTLANIIDSLPEIPDNIQHFTIQPVTRRGVLECIKSLRSDSSTGADTIPARFVKLVAEYLANPLTHIINNCIKRSYFPTKWKMARVSPIPKVVNPTSMNELRPISILPVLSKVFEKAVGIQIMSFAERASLLHEGLSSFRKVHSTTTALLGMRDDIRKAMDKGEVTLMVMADFSKSFDTICFRTTLLKLHKVGFTKPSLKWLLSYLCDRRQFVQIDDKSSSCQTIAFGLSQGSILGPMIFNLYVSDLKDVIPASIKCSQYADDTTLYHHTPVQDLVGGVSLMNNALSELHSWSKESNLALNPDKTKSMVF